MSLSLTLKADLLWKQTHIPLFLPGCLLRTGNDCRELCFVPHVRLDEIHGAERNHTKQQHEHTHNHWMASRTLRSPHPPPPPKLQPTIRPLWTALHQDHPTQQMLPQRASSKKNPSPVGQMRRRGLAPLGASGCSLQPTHKRSSICTASQIFAECFFALCSGGWSPRPCFFPIASFA